MPKVHGVLRITGRAEARSSRGGPIEARDPDKVKPLVRVVIEAVAHEDPDVSRAALSTLRTLGRAAQQEAVPGLIRVIEKGTRDARPYALDILAHLGPEAEPAVPTLRALRNQISGTPDAASEMRLIDTALSRIQFFIRPEAEAPPGPGGKPASEEKTAEPRR